MLRIRWLFAPEIVDVNYLQCVCNASLLVPGAAK